MHTPVGAEEAAKQHLVPLSVCRLHTKPEEAEAAT